MTQREPRDPESPRAISGRVAAGAAPYHLVHEDEHGHVIASLDTSAVAEERTLVVPRGPAVTRDELSAGATAAEVRG